MLKVLLAILVTACHVSPMVYDRGVPNLDKVDEGVYRSGQVATQEGWDHIRDLAAGRSVHVIKLNYDNEGDDELGDLMGFAIEYLPVQPQGDRDALDDLKSAFRGPEQGVVDEAIRELRACHDRPATLLCLVHCTHGQDRTGYVVGQYRVRVDGWTKAEAYAEMRAHHFHWELRGVREAWEGWKP